MSFIKLSHSLRALLTALCLALCLLPCLAWGEDGEDTLDLFNAFQETSSTASRAPKPLSQTAENVTVITAKEIEALNAHTLADVLASVSGLQTWSYGGPGSISIALIQGSDFRHLQVLLDDIPLNNLGDNFADTALVPANIIERIELIKGAASSSWGQALGGVINVITKTPNKERAIGGSAYASNGERTTTDTRAELTGTSGSLGYYISGGYLGSNGLKPQNNHLSSNNAYAKLTYDLSGQGQIWGTFSYNRALRENLFLPAIDYKQDQSFRYLYASLGFRKPITEQLNLEFIARHATRNIDTLDSILSDSSLNQAYSSKNQSTAASAKLIWRVANNLLVAGGEYEHNENWDTTAETSFLKAKRWGLFLNDTITLGPVAVTPGVRYDHTGNLDNQFSPSLGCTWQFTDNTLLRAYTGRGFSLPAITDKSAQKVWANQIGVESTAVPYIWLKGSLFRNDIWNISDDLQGQRHLALGGEIEARTVPVWNTSLSAAWSYTDTYRTSDGTAINGPTQTVQLALRYDDQTYRGQLTGRHIWWNSNIEPGNDGKYYGLIWDLHLGATLLKRENNSLELFFSGHNLFNGNQYWHYLIPNTGRWFEGGMRVRF